MRPLLYMVGLGVLVMSAACIGAAEDDSMESVGSTSSALTRTRVGSDDGDCVGTIRFGAGGPTVSAGQTRSFSVTGANFLVLCSDTLPFGRHTVDCPSNADWFVVNRVNMPGEWEVACYVTSSAPPPPPPAPKPCPTGQRCCEPGPTPGTCDLCVPNGAACP